MKSFKKLWLFFCTLLLVNTILANDTTRAPQSTFIPDENNAGITLPAGFGALAVVDSLGVARHIVINKNGDIYVRLQRLKNGKSIYLLKDTNGDGKADQISGFGTYAGTGIAIKNGYLYASSNKEVYRYKLNDKNQVDTSSGEIIVKGLIDKNQHNAKAITLDNAGNLYVNIGAPSNACQVQDRTPGSPGRDPCPILDSAAGVWQFKADKLNQSYAEGVRYITGTRNIVGLDWNTSINELFVMQHGRDDLSRLFPTLFTPEQSTEQPAEEMLLAKKSSNFGWPYCYFDWQQDKKLLNPEYGGDGKKEGRCADVPKPVVAFPGHWAPNGLLFYTGTAFPEKYRNGAFIAFHGSWDRSPAKQAGYFVAFVPFKDGKPSGKWEPFAEGFAGKEVANANEALHRPCGLAQGPDGSLYVTDDVKGKIYKIAYTGK